MNLKRNFTSEAQLNEMLDFIYEQSSKGGNFHGIIEAAFNEVTIVTAIHNIKTNKGANTPGVDNNKMDKYLQMDKQELITLVQREVKHYRPKPVRRVYIKKSNGKLRPIGIPTTIDKIIQECLRIILEPIAEAKFYPHSYGFRPYRATKHALKNMVNILSKPAKGKPIYVIEGDITGYFDNVNHRIMLKKLWNMGIHDKRVLSIIREMLKAGYMEGDTKYDTDTGTAQGSVISTLLANIYLNDFDWTVGRMYQYPKTKYKHFSSARKHLRDKGICPKYLTRYADDWTLLTTKAEEAERLLKYLKKYFRHRLRLELSNEKTVITNLMENHASFLGSVLKVDYPRATPERPRPVNTVCKHYPDMKKVKAKVKEAGNEIRKLKNMNIGEKAIQIERINAKITGLGEYYKTMICSSAFSYIDSRLYKTARATFKAMYPETFKNHLIPLCELANRPQRHKGLKTRTFAIKHKGMNIGITRVFPTHSQWLRYPFNQQITPYSSRGRELYLNQCNRHKQLPSSRPPLYDITTLCHVKEDTPDNFEYYMNREYAYNRDKGKCKICGCILKAENRHCHRVTPSLPVNKINKVPNLVWICYNCDKSIHGEKIPESFDRKRTGRINKYREKLIM